MVELLGTFYLQPLNYEVLRNITKEKKFMKGSLGHSHLRRLGGTEEICREKKVSTEEFGWSVSLLWKNVDVGYS